MPVKGQVITNPINGDTHEYIETSEDTNGERVVMKATIKSKGQLVPKHFHALQDETFEIIENLVGLAADGKSKNGKFGLVQELVTLKYLESKSYLADMPLGIQKLLMNTVAPIGRLLGYRAIYKKYSGIEK